MDKENETYKNYIVITHFVSGARLRRAVLFFFILFLACACGVSPFSPLFSLGACLRRAILDFTLFPLGRACGAPIFYPYVNGLGYKFPWDSSRGVAAKSFWGLDQMVSPSSPPGKNFFQRAYSQGGRTRNRFSVGGQEIWTYAPVPGSARVTLRTPVRVTFFVSSIPRPVRP